MFTITGMENSFASLLTPTMSSGRRGANTEVVGMMHKISSRFMDSSFSRRAGRFVLSSSPSRTGSMMIGSRPVVKMLFKHVFWSTRNQITYLAVGLFSRNESKHMLMLMPVARGRTMQSFTSVIPHVWIKSIAIFRVNSQIKEEPAALG